MVITSLLFAATFLETPIPGDPDVAFAAFAPLPKPFGEKDRQKLAVAVRTLVDGSQEYTRRTVYNITDGRTVDVALLPDGVAVRFTVPKENLSNGIALMDGLLRRPIVDETTLARALVRIQRREPGYWAAALRPLRNDVKTLKAPEARALLQRVFQPQRTVVVVAGGFTEGQAEVLWERRTADWKLTAEPRYPDITPKPEPKDNPSGVTTVELRGPAIKLADPELPTRWLALIALGVGKGSSLFRDVRQVEGWSYRQEAILWPDAAGLVPRIVAASAPEEGEAARAEALRTALQKSAEGWTAKDLKRALSVAELTLADGQPLGPLWLADGPVSNDLDDRALLDAYWFAKSGSRWDATKLLSQMRAVTLDDLKATATA
ncbi:insulinase family protein, partial [bacterium]